MRTPDRYGERRYGDPSYDESRRGAARARGQRDPRAFESPDDELRDRELTDRDRGAFADESAEPFGGSRARYSRGHPRDPYDRGDTIDPSRRPYGRDQGEYEPRDPGRWRADPRFDPDEGFAPGRRSPWDDMDDWQKPWQQGVEPRSADWRYRSAEPRTSPPRQAWERSGGPFRGRGPKDYRRSDERLLEEVCDRLTDHGEIDASELSVSVRDGEVTLQGRVPERHMKRLAEDCAESVSGVQQVHNQVRIENARATGSSGSPASEIRAQQPLVR